MVADVLSNSSSTSRETPQKRWVTTVTRLLCCVWGYVFWADDGKRCRGVKDCCGVRPKRLLKFFDLLCVVDPRPRRPSSFGSRGSHAHGSCLACGLSIGYPLLTRCPSHFCHGKLRDSSHRFPLSWRPSGLRYLTGAIETGERQRQRQWQFGMSLCSPAYMSSMRINPSVLWSWDRFTECDKRDVMCVCVCVGVRRRNSLVSRTCGDGLCASLNLLKRRTNGARQSIWTRGHRFSFTQGKFRSRNWNVESLSRKERLADWLLWLFKRCFSNVGRVSHVERGNWSIVHIDGRASLLRITVNPLYWSVVPADWMVLLCFFGWLRSGGVRRDERDWEGGDELGNSVLSATWVRYDTQYRYYGYRNNVTALIESLLK
jgi:hypothetical protein